LPKNLQQNFYGLFTSTDVIAASEKDKNAYLNKYWPDIMNKDYLKS